MFFFGDLDAPFVGGCQCRVGVESGGDFTTFHGFSIGEPGIENMGCFSKEVLLMDTKNPALFSEEAFKVEGEIDFFLKKKNVFPPKLDRPFFFLALKGERTSPKLAEK